MSEITGELAATGDNGTLVAAGQVGPPSWLATMHADRRLSAIAVDVRRPKLVVDSPQPQH
jgi:hypothetical protein